MTVSLEELVKSGAHFGHQSRRWNPKMAPFLYGEKDGVHIFDLTQTKEKLEEALNFLKKASKTGKTIVFVGTKKQAKEKVTEVAKLTKSFYITERWLGGTLTNFEQIKKSTRKLIDLKDGLAKGTFKDYTKKERLLMERDMAKLERYFGGLIGLESRPDVLIVIDVKKERSVIREAAKMKVPVVGMVDSNSEPDTDYIIPMNDDATKALEYVLDLMKNAILEGKGVKSEKKDLKPKKVVKKVKSEEK